MAQYVIIMGDTQEYSNNVQYFDGDTYSKTYTVMIPSIFRIYTEEFIISY